MTHSHHSGCNALRCSSPMCAIPDPHTSATPGHFSLPSCGVPMHPTYSGGDIRRSKPEEPAAALARTPGTTTPAFTPLAADILLVRRLRPASMHPLVMWDWQRLAGGRAEFCRVGSLAALVVAASRVCHHSQPVECWVSRAEGYWALRGLG